MDRKLLDYLPPVLREVVDFQAISGASEPELSLAWDTLARVLDNQFLDSADAAGTALWEGELGLRPRDTDPLTVRKARVKAAWNLELPYTWPWLKNWLTGLCGPDGHEEKLTGNVLAIRLDTDRMPRASEQIAEVLASLAAVCPVNVRVQVEAGAACTSCAFAAAGALGAELVHSAAAEYYQYQEG